MKVSLVCGGRDFIDWEAAEEELESLSPEMIVHGGARGADTLAGRFALERGLPCLCWPADWNAHGKAAGFIRNRQMAEFLDGLRMLGHQTLVVAFPGGKGTASMVKIANEMAFKVWEIEE